jgi:hypothetical protein
MHNSITRVLELLIADIPVRIGTDNVEDFFLPPGIWMYTTKSVTLPIVCDFTISQPGLKSPQGNG